VGKCPFWVIVAVLVSNATAAAQTSAGVSPYNPVSTPTSPYNPIPPNSGPAASQAPAGMLPNYPSPPKSNTAQPQGPAGAPNNPTSSTTTAGLLPVGYGGLPLSSTKNAPAGSGPNSGPEIMNSPRAANDNAWFSGEFLLWWIKGANVPPLVTTGPPGTTGALGQPGTTVLFGPDSDLFRSPSAGGRFTAGCWFDEEHVIGVEGSYFFVAPRGDHFSAAGDGSPGSPIISRPFFNTATGMEDSELVNFPGVVAGRVSVDPTSRLQGYEANLLCNLCCSCNWSLDCLAGFRYLDLDEGLGITENLTVLPSVPLIGGTQFVVQDHFNTHNQFYGGQLGLRGQVWQGCFFAVANLKCALGDSQQGVDIAGFTTITPPGGPATTQSGGLLALPSNGGHFFGDRFAVVPEGSLVLGYQVTEHVSLTVGYTFLYWSNVARPGDQIDRGLNPAALPLNGAPPTPTSRPAFLLQDSDFWVQGLTFGLELRF
jgi:hypothetical protein